MWSTRKFFIALAIAAVLVVVSIGGVVLAQENDEDAPAAKFGDFLDKVCAIYESNTGDDIDPEALKEAVAQAQSERQAAAMEARLDKMVENGVLDETQARELQDWWESRPEDLPFGPGLGGRGMMSRGFGGHGGFGPPPPPEGSEPIQLPE